MMIVQKPVRFIVHSPGMPPWDAAMLVDRAVENRQTRAALARAQIQTITECNIELEELILEGIGLIAMSRAVIPLEMSDLAIRDKGAIEYVD